MAELLQFDEMHHYKKIAMPQVSCGVAAILIAVAASNEICNKSNEWELLVFFLDFTANFRIFVWRNSYCRSG